MSFLVRVIFSLVILYSIHCLPTKEHLIQGNIQILQDDKLLSVIQNSEQAIIEWGEFCVDVQEQVHFQCLKENSSILNRVIGPHFSQIDGRIESNGNVFLINENGILIGPTSIIDTKGFVGSTLDLKNEDFLEKRLIFQGHKNGWIQNQGLIRSRHQNIYLVSNRVNNQGKIQVEEGDIYFLSGSEASNKQDRIHIQSTLETDVINQEGIVEAIQMKEKGGRLFLLGEKGTIHLRGSHIAKKQEKGGEITITSKEVNLYEGTVLDCSGRKGGGKIFVGGGFQGTDPSIYNSQSVWVSKQAELKADAQELGDGGQVIIWSDKQTLFGGKISARGGDKEGDGGFVEVSSPGTWLFRGEVDTKAFNGKYGKLLLDPSDITIDNFGGSSTPAFPTTPPGTYNPTGATGSLDVSDVQTTLGSNNVTVLTSGGTGGTGSITINQGFTWSATTTFTATADRNILIDGVTLNSTGTGSFTAFDLQANQAGATTGNFVGILLDAATISSVDGDISLAGRGGDTGGDAGVEVDVGSQINSTGTGVNAATISLVGTGGSGGTNCHGIYIHGTGAQVSSIDGNISLTGTSNGTGGSNYGIYLMSSGTVESTGTTSDAATITLNGTGASGTSSNFGVRVNGTSSSIASVVGNIDITAVGGSGSTGANRGLYLNSNGSITSTGTGVDAATVTIEATGSSGTANNDGVLIENSGTTITITGNVDITATGNGTTTANRGLRMQGGAILESTGTGSDAATITIDAEGGAGTNTNGGIFINNAGTTIRSVDGDMMISGTGRGTGTNCNGVFIDGNSSISSTGTTSSASDITITATGAGTTGSGIRIDNTSVSAVAGDITITSTGAGSASGLNMNNASAVIGGGSTTGDITINTDTAILDGTIQGSGDLVVQPITASTSIGLGTGATGTLNLTSTELGVIQDGFSSITFGLASGTGAIEMTTFTYLDPLTVRGGSITTTSAIGAGSNAVQFNIGSASAGTLNLNAVVTTSGIFTVTGGSSNDAFNINVTGQTATLQGSGGTNTLTGPSSSNAWIITSDNGGTLNTTISFSSMQNLTGNSSTDAFTFNGAFQVTGTIDGSGGTNTLTGPGVNNSWAVTSTNAGTITPTGAPGATSFTSIQNLTGGSSDDDFVLSDGIGVTGTIDGGNASGNTLDFSAYTTAVTVNLGSASATNVGGIANLQSFIGGSSTDTFIGANTTNIWNITANDAGNVEGISFTSFENLTGGSVADNFIFSGAFQITGTIDGSGGTNTLTGPGVNNSWAVTSTNAGTITPTGAPGATSFTSIQNLTGGSSDDDFVLSDGIGVAGTIDGGNASGNTLDFSAYTTAVTVNLGSASATNVGGIANLQSFIGGSSTDTFIGANTTNIWNITANDAGNVEGISFTSFENLTGGSVADNFIFSGAFRITGTIDGSGGTNTLTGPGVNNSWAVASTNAGTITPTGAPGATSFTRIQNLTGGSSDDDFVLSDGIGVTGTIDGGNASGNTLDFSAYTTMVTVNLGSASATNVGGIANLQSFIGGSSTDTFIGANTTNTWNITANNAGNVGGISFTSFENLTGGSSDDTFNFTPGFIISGSLNGNGGINTFLAPDTDNTWNITENNGGTVIGISFTNIQNLTGGSGEDIFIFSNQKGVSGLIDGGIPANINTLDYSLFNPPAKVIELSPTSGLASNLGVGYQNIGNVIGNVSFFDLVDIAKFNTELSLLQTEPRRYLQISDSSWIQFDSPWFLPIVNGFLYRYKGFLKYSEKQIENHQISIRDLKASYRKLYLDQ